MNFTESQMVVLLCWTGVNCTKYVGYESGIDAMFQPNGETGIKFFKDEESAKHSFGWSRIFYAMGYGVKVWNLNSMSIVDVLTKQRRTVYFFECERAVILKNMCKAKNHHWKYEKRLVKLICKVIDRINNEFGIQISDAHIGNFGIIRGRIVPIDFGQLYVNDVYFSS